MQVYYDAELKALANILLLAFREPASSTYSQLRLEVWEAVYQVMLSLLSPFAHSRDLQCDTSLDSLLDDISNHLRSLPKEF